MRERIQEIAAGIFSIPVDDMPPDASTDTLAGWDSLRHLELMLAIEEVVLGVPARHRVGDDLDDLAGEEPLDDGLDRLAGHEGDHLGRVQPAEIGRVVGQQPARCEIGRAHV